MNDIPNDMKGVQLTGHGDIDKLMFRDDIPVPPPGPRDVPIKVGAAGVNNTDLNTRVGWCSKSKDPGSTVIQAMPTLYGKTWAAHSTWTRNNCPR